MASHGPPLTVLALLAAYAASSGVTLAIAAYAFRYRWREPTARAFGLLALALTVWTVGTGARLLATDLGAKLAWNLLAYCGLVVVPPAWFVFVLRFTGRPEWVSRRFLAFLAIHPVVTLVALATNPYHGYFYGPASLSSGAVWPTLQSNWTPLFAAHTAYAYALFVLGAVLLATYAMRTRRPFRDHSLLLIFVGVGIWLSNVAYLAGFEPYPGVDPSPIAFGIGAVPVAIAVFRVRLIDILPVARQAVLDAIDDAIVVIDDRGFLVDANPAGLALASGGERAIGEVAASVLPDALVDTGVVTNRTDDGGEVRIATDGGPRWYWARRLPLGGARDEGGAVLVLTDVTAQHRHRESLERQNEQLDDLAHVVSHDLRNPLAAGQGHLRIARNLLDGLAIPEERASDLDRSLDAVEHANERIDAIVEDLLTLARQGRHVDVDERVDVRAAATAAWEAIDTGDLKLLTVGSITVEADERRLERLFERCFQNVVDHATGATVVRVGAFSGTGQTADATDAADEHVDRGFYVEDDGPGIADEDRAAVFQYGHSTSASGSGLGLAVVEEIASAHGWTARVADAASGGARIEVVVSA